MSNSQDTAIVDASRDHLSTLPVEIRYGIYHNLLPPVEPQGRDVQRTWQRPRLCGSLIGVNTTLTAEFLDYIGGAKGRDYHVGIITPTSCSTSISVAAVIPGLHRALSWAVSHYIPCAKSLHITTSRALIGRSLITLAYIAYHIMWHSAAFKKSPTASAITTISIISLDALEGKEIARIELRKNLANSKWVGPVDQYWDEPSLVAALLEVAPNHPLHEILNGSVDVESVVDELAHRAVIAFDRAKTKAAVNHARLQRQRNVA